MRLLLDEMWTPMIAAQLRQRGHDVVAIADRPDLRGRPDDIVFAVAQAESRVVVTENVSDFRPLAARALQRGQSHSGLVLTSNQRFPRHDRRTAGRLVTALDQLLAGTPTLEGREHWLELWNRER